MSRLCEIIAGCAKKPLPIRFAQEAAVALHLQIIIGQQIEAVRLKDLF